MTQHPIISARTGKIVGYADTPEPAMPTVEEVRAARREDFRSTADPVFLKWQRGEATEQDWLDAVQAVRSSHPYPE